MDVRPRGERIGSTMLSWYLVIHSWSNKQFGKDSPGIWQISPLLKESQRLLIDDRDQMDRN